jgi:hypothetical protein
MGKSKQKNNQFLQQSFYCFVFILMFLEPAKTLKHNYSCGVGENPVPEMDGRPVAKCD